MKDGLILMYIKGETVYPVAMNQEQYDMLQIMVPPIFPNNTIKLINEPQGKAINYMDRRGCNE